jgi:glycosyltransferase involved in cell wall biosynthesis
MSIGIFILNCPVADYYGRLHLGDVCYRQTLEINRELFDRLIVVARRRFVTHIPINQISLDEIGAKLGLELPDYGIGGIKGMINAIRLFHSPLLRVKLRDMVMNAGMIYIEGPSVEGYWAAKVANNADTLLIMENRGDTVLNRQYMKARFGLKGILLSWIMEKQYSFIRKQATAGLYINYSLMKKYPVVGPLQEAISDVRLPDNVFGQPRNYNNPARRFLCVGHLEKVKRIDWLLRALRLAYDKLSSKWTLDVVGDGPEEPNLRQLVLRLEIQPNVIFHGRVVWGDPLFKLYRNADLFLISSLTESGPRTLIEAMALGLPVLSTAVGQAPELLDSCAVVPVHDLDGYVNCMVNMANDSSILTRLSNQNWNNAQSFRLSVLMAKRRAFFLNALKSTSQKPIPTFQ